MSSYKLPFGLVLKEATIIRLFLINRLLLLRYVLIVCHNNPVKLVSLLCNAPIRLQRYTKNPTYARDCSKKSAFVSAFYVKSLNC